MALADLRVEDYSYRLGVHSWKVEEIAIPISAYWEVRFYNPNSFGSGPDKLLCSCYKVAPGAEPLVCNHTLAVAQHITRKAGEWERDSSLMEYAWKLAGMRNQLRVERAESSVANMLRFVVTDPYKNISSIVAHFTDEGKHYCTLCEDKSYSFQEGCEHIEAVRRFETNELYNKPKKPEIEIKADTKLFKEFAKLINEEMIRIPKTIFDEIKASKDLKPGDPVYFDPAETKGPATWRASYVGIDQENLEKKIAEIEQLKKEIKKKSEGPKNPGPPAKPRNRFSEIDL